MATVTLTEPSADEQQVMLYNKRMRAFSTKVLDTGQKYVVCLVQVAPVVTPADYPALKAAVEAIAGIQKISLLVDGQTPASIPAGKELQAVCGLHLRIEDQPEP